MYYVLLYPTFSRFEIDMPCAETEADIGHKLGSGDLFGEAVHCAANFTL
jgi:hypothetical protein